MVVYFLATNNLLKLSVLLVLSNYYVFVVTRPLSRGGSMAKDQEPQKPDNSPGPGLEVVERQRVAKKVSSAKSP